MYFKWYKVFFKELKLFLYIFFYLKRFMVGIMLGCWFFFILRFMVKDIGKRMENILILVFDMYKDIMIVDK